MVHLRANRVRREFGREESRLPFQLRRIPGVIRVEEGNEVAAREAVTDVASVGDPAVRRAHQSYARVIDRGERGLRVVGGPAVDDDDLVNREGLAQDAL